MKNYSFAIKVAYICVVLPITLYAAQQNMENPLFRALKNYSISSSNDKKNALVLVENELRKDMNPHRVPLSEFLQDKNTLQLFLQYGGHIHKEDDEGRDILTFASMRGDVELMKILIDSGANINRKISDYKQNPLYIAMMGRNVELVESLLRHGANVFDENNLDRSTILRYLLAIYRNAFNVGDDFSNIIKLIIGHSGCVDYKSPVGQTFLHSAIQRGDDKMVNFLLSNGASVGIKNNEHLTPLENAVECYGSTSIEMMSDKFEPLSHIIKSLITFGAPVNLQVTRNHNISHKALITRTPVDLKSNRNESILHKAVIHNDNSLVNFLLSKGALYDVENCKNQTPFDFALACYEMCSSSDLDDCRSVLQSFITYGAPVDYKVCTWSPLHVAVLRGDDKMVKFLLSKGAFVGIKNNKSQTPLNIAEQVYEACILKIKDNNNQTHLNIEEQARVNIEEQARALEHSRKIIKVMKLLASKVPVDDKDAMNQSLLHRAVAFRMLDMVKFLLVRGASPEIEDNDKRTPLDIAVENYKWSDVSRVPEASDLIKALITFGGSVTFQKAINQNLLHIAANQSDARMVEFLLSKGACVEIKNNKGQTPLDIAVGMYKWWDSSLLPDTRDAIKALITSGGSVSLQKAINQNLLHCAVDFSDVEMVKFLLSNGACVEIKNNDGQTPLDLAIEHYEYCEPSGLSAARSVLQSFITSGVPVDYKDAENRSFFDMAKGLKDAKFEEFLHSSRVNPYHNNHTQEKKDFVLKKTNLLGKMCTMRLRDDDALQNNKLCPKKRLRSEDDNDDVLQNNKLCPKKRLRSQDDNEAMITINEQYKNKLLFNEVMKELKSNPAEQYKNKLLFNEVMKELKSKSAEE